MLLDAYADDLRAGALNTYVKPPPAPGASEPGMFKGLVPGAGAYFMRGMAEAGRALSMAGAVVPIAADMVFSPDSKAGMGTEASAYFETHDKLWNSAIDYWTPKPSEVGAAGQVVGSLGAGIVQFLASPALMIATNQLGTSEDLVRQGVDAGAALVAGDVAGLSTAAGIALPIFGKSLGGRIATGALGNLATNVPEAAIKRAVVDSAGRPDVAAQFDPWDARARTIDLLLGAVFGAKAHWDAKVEAGAQAAAVAERRFVDGPLPSAPTATQSAIDALMVMNSARHLEEAAFPRGFGGGEADVAQGVANVRTAMGQLLRGEPVNVPTHTASVDAGGPFRLDPFRVEVEGLVRDLLPPSGRPIEAPEMSPPAPVRPEDVGRTGTESQDGQSTTGPRFADDLMTPTGDFDAATGEPRSISANEYVAKAQAEADHVKATAQHLMETAATCLLGGV